VYKRLRTGRKAAAGCVLISLKRCAKLGKRKGRGKRSRPPTLEPPVPSSLQGGGKPHPPSHLNRTFPISTLSSKQSHPTALQQPSAIRHQPFRHPPIKASVPDPSMSIISTPSAITIPRRGHALAAQAPRRQVAPIPSLGQSFGGLRPGVGGPWTWQRHPEKNPAIRKKTSVAFRAFAWRSCRPQISVV
jgi:hypothetical protein